MLHKIAIAEDEAAEATDNISVTSEMLDKLELGSSTTTSSSNTATTGSSGEKMSVASAMSSVFGGSSSTKSSGSASTSRTSSPTRKSLKASIFHRRSHSHDVDGAGGSKPDKDSDAYRLARWLQKGNVIYKSVGLGLMDLTVGMHLVKYAEEKGVGSRIEGF